MDDIEASLQADCQARVGQALGGKWVLEQLIGVGGMAAVYAARHRNGAVAAIKLLRPELAKVPEIRSRFQREAYIANKVDHLGSVKVLDDDQTDTGEPYLVMELLRGQSVAKLAEQRGGRLPQNSVLNIANQLLQVLERAHAVGVVHRDLKPENLFLTQEKVVKVLDFGIARLREPGDQHVTMTGTMMGTPAYMAPEQALGRWSDVDARTDLWAVGAIMFSLLTARAVHEAETSNEMLIRAATRPAESLARFVDGPLRLVSLVDKALSFDQSQRFATAADMRRELMGLVEELRRQQSAAAPAAGSAPSLSSGRAPEGTTSSGLPPSSSLSGGVGDSAITISATGSGVGPAVTSRRPSIQPRQPPKAISIRESARGSGSSLRPRPDAPRTDDSDSRAVLSRGLPSQRPSGGPSLQAKVVRTATGEPSCRPRSSQDPLPRTRSQPARPSERPQAEPRFGNDSIEPGSDSGRSIQGGGARPSLSRPSDYPTATATDTAFTTDSEADAMAELFTQTERALVAQLQYGRSHPESRKRFERLFGQLISTMAGGDIEMVWDVTPYSFAAGSRSLWEPRAPFDRIPYQLFSDGVRKLGILAGITEEEFERFLGILVLDRTKEVAPEDDFVTLLWDADFEHIVHVAIDTFAEGDQEERARFVRNVQQVMDGALAPDKIRLEEAWRRQRRGPEGDSLEAQHRKLVECLVDLGGDLQSRARVANLALPELGPDSPDLHRLLALDPAVVRVLTARMVPDTSITGERFVMSAAGAYRYAHDLGKGQGLASPLRSAIDGLAQAAPEAAIALIGALCEAVGQPDDPAATKAYRAGLTGHLVSKQTFECILEGATRGDADRDLYRRGLRIILEYLDGTHVPVAVRALASLRDDELCALLLGYLGHAAAGYEPELAALFTDAELGMGIALVRVLAALGTAEAKDAIAEAARSPHSLVRIEALGHVDGASSERLRIELRRLLDDRETDVRIAALRTMRQHGIRVAGPFLVLRIKSSDFDQMGGVERHEALLTLAALAPARAEAVCLQLLAETRMVSSEGHEHSRELAAEILGMVASGPEAIAALERAASARWRSSERVRHAAAKALGRIRRESEHPKGSA